MSRRTALGMAGAAALLLMAACAAEPDDPPKRDGRTPQFDDPDSLGVQTAADDPAAAAYQSGATAFALSMLAAALADDQANAVISPLSISQCMALVAQGAAGDTLTQIAAALGCADQEQLRSGANAEITAIAGMQQAVFDMANTAFTDESFPLKDEYAAAVAEWFGVAPHGLDFADPAAATAAINSWVAQRTNDKIPELLQAGQVTPDTRTVLVNALYLNALWAQEFDPDRTFAGEFTLDDASTVTVDYLKDNRDVSYAELPDGGFVFSLPYQEESLRALFYLPPEGSSLADAVADLTPDALNQVVEGMQEGYASLHIPVFEVRQRIELSSALAGLGIVDAFDDVDANFTALSDEPTFLSFVQHEAWLKVAEKGTEGAAATAGGMEAGSASPQDQVELWLNRPFLFAVGIPATASYAFVAAIADPSEA